MPVVFRFFFFSSNHNKWKHLPFERVYSNLCTIKEIKKIQNSLIGRSCNRLNSVLLSSVWRLAPKDSDRRIERERERDGKVRVNLVASIVSISAIQFGRVTVFFIISNFSLSKTCSIEIYLNWFYLFNSDMFLFRTFYARCK